MFINRLLNCAAPSDLDLNSTAFGYIHQVFHIPTDLFIIYSKFINYVCIIYRNF